eukprot:320193_1
MGDSCRMMDFYYYYKSQHDSRCYIFDDICYVISNKNSNYKINQSVIYYKSFDPSRSNYPYDWKDNIGDNCDAYTEYNWCDNSTLFRNRNDFEQLVDNKYGLMQRTHVVTVEEVLISLIMLHLVLMNIGVVLKPMFYAILHYNHLVQRINANGIVWYYISYVVIWIR